MDQTQTISTTYEGQDTPEWQIALDYQDGSSVGSHDTLVVLDLESGKITLGTRPCRGWYDAGYTPRRWYGVEQTWEVPPPTDAEALDAALRDHTSPLRQALERVYRGGDVYIDARSNLDATLDDDAQDAKYEIVGIIQGLPETTWDVWDASEWLHSSHTDEQIAKDLGITAVTTDDEIQRILADLQSTADDDRVVFWGSLLDVLQEVRDALEG